MSTYGKKSIGELLLEKGIISQTQLEQAKREQQKTGDSIFRVLPRLGFIMQDLMVEFISDNSNIPRVEIDNLLIDPKVIELVPEDLARKHFVMPILRIGNNLTCAMVDVFNIYVQDELASKTGLTIEPAISTENEIKKAIDEYYSVKTDMTEVLKNLDEKNGPTIPKEDLDPAQVQSAGGEEAPVVTFVNSMIAKAASEGASDIHIEPEEKTLVIRFRIDGILHIQTSPPKQYQPAILSRIKILAKLDISELRKPQDGRIQM
ncbi:MAG: Flp pilus assembly complex ATPase component TadA, partial [Candidatus Omnitrophica bacterium]|nr:Flp pilus assembly complex ATPase component TadA [Candidatus Omnitrophota bacterium]